MNTAALLFISFAALLLLNVPIALSLGASSLIAMVVTGLPLDMFPMQIYANIGKFTLLAIPFFMLAGNTMEKAGISDKLINLANKFVGHKTGGLAIVGVITSCFFAAISGSGPATVASLGVIIIPAMINAGYSKGMSSALMATAGGIGVIIPPSIPFVVYGAIAGVSIGKIFMAGIVPGLLMGTALVIASLIMAKKMDIEPVPKASAKERWEAFKDAIWGLMMPVIILGGIYGGFFTPTEAAAVSAVYGILVGVFVYRKIKAKDLYDLMVESAIGSAIVMFIVAAAGLFAWFCTTEGISDMASDLLLSVSGSKYMFLFIVNIILLIAGCFLDATSALYIFTPIMLPVATQLGYDPIALGVVMTMNLAIGMITPPVGVNLYVACGVSKISLGQISKAVVPYLIASLIVLFLITYVPDIILWLPNMMGIK
ncbi:C4-dicarboxylate TRAP transporter large permease protein DctM [bioreactor metagenome]|jgi:C4-dicarboxylate transporter DctM subunit|uniref:C4-dicarboxylate transporter DctM subunit n=2 Tax=root TaxID=1 RepID=A0A562JEA4_9FIRM|nr:MULTISPECIES: TRAP transporter large permease [Sedimentibacter]MEA5095338.1 TRAP transporter large permease [Sedimentibacter saalensis]TWH81501.1 C4-dicarboxylate transporter DctM subunit [Sedimentibacter saalensis]